MHTLKLSFLGFLLLSYFPVAGPASAGHIDENLFGEVYRELNTPVCIHSNEVDGTTIDCENPDPVVVACWRQNLHLYYDQDGLIGLLEEIRASNQKYKFFNEPYYNEFFSNRNWDNVLSCSDKCN